MRFTAFIILCLSSTITFGQIPSANFSMSDDQFCQGACITVTNNSTGNPINFEWTFQGGTPAVYNGAKPWSYLF
jgi:hypothetical protein